MGKPKGDLLIGGRPILRYLLESMRWPGPTLLVTAPGRENPPGYELFDGQAVDAVAEGPLRGILTALENSTTDQVVVVTLDMPGMGREQLEWLLDVGWTSSPADSADGGRVHPPYKMMSRIVDGKIRIEPFPLVVHREAEGAIAAHLGAGNRAVHSLSDLAGFAVYAAPEDWPARVWTNLNTPQDYESFLRNA
jgi:molybdopterin-guanine dinucleotide biosynthesis protein A